MTFLRPYVTAAIATSLVLAGCLSDGQDMKSPSASHTASFVNATTLPAEADDGAGEETALSVTGPWTSGTAIDARYTCDSTGVAPPLTWSNGPANVAAYGIVLRDNDAANYIHWVVTNIDPSVTAIGEAALPLGVFVAKNTAGKKAYAPPCPPVGSSHQYTITVYALSRTIKASQSPSAVQVIAEMEASALEVATTDFVYSR